MPALQPQEVADLIRCLREASGFITDLRERNEIASHVQYPKIPPALSESLAVQAIQDGRLLPAAGPFSSVTLGGQVADILATPVGHPPLRIEIKASGVQEFATFGDKDYAADYLLWMLFGNTLQAGRGGYLQVLVCPRPRLHLPKPHRNRVTTAQLRSAWTGPALVEVQLAIPV